MVVALEDGAPFGSYLMRQRSSSTTGLDGAASRTPSSGCEGGSCDVSTKMSSWSGCEMSSRKAWSWECTVGSDSESMLNCGGGSRRVTRGGRWSGARRRAAAHPSVRLPARHLRRERPEAREEDQLHRLLDKVADGQLQLCRVGELLIHRGKRGLAGTGTTVAAGKSDGSRPPTRRPSSSRGSPWESRWSTGRSRRRHALWA